MFPLISLTQKGLTFRCDGNEPTVPDCDGINGGGLTMEDVPDFPVSDRGEGLTDAWGEI